MSGFSEFVKDFCIVAVSGGLILLIAPCKAMKKQVKFIISVCTVCALLSAVISVSADLEKYVRNIGAQVETEISGVTEDTRKSLAEQAKKNMERETAELICARYGICEDDVYVVAEIDTSNLAAIEVVRINVFLSDASYAESVKAYTTDIFGNAVEVLVLQKGSGHKE